MGRPQLRVAIHTLGTRGDVQPYLALAVELKVHGHEVLLAAPSQFESFVSNRGIEFAHLPAEFLDLMEAPEAKAAMAGSGGFAAGFKMLKQFKPIGRKQLTQEWEAARQFQPELMIYHPKAIGVSHLGERLSCPTVLASPLPGFTPTAEFASPMVPFRSLGPLNKLTHGAMAGSAEAVFRGMIAEWRENELGLSRRPKRKLGPAAVLYAYSAHIVPRPSDWADNVCVSGYWFLEGPAWEPEPGLRAFLDAGAPPVFIGFGSMPGLDPDHLGGLVVEALSLAGKRGVLATGGGAMRVVSEPGHVFQIAGAPHDRLFPLMSTCVHHGGAGTTGAALRAGKPQVICPFFGDQPFWGRRAADTGVASPPLALRQLSAGQLAAAIQAVTEEPAYLARAQQLGSLIELERGTAQALQFLRLRGLLD
jgi:sterol 3beta-glucosyltransferase